MATLSEPTAGTMTSADGDSDAAAALPANLRPLPPALSGGCGVAEEPIDVDSTGLDSLLSAMGSGAHVDESTTLPPAPPIPAGMIEIKGTCGRGSTFLNPGVTHRQFKPIVESTGWQIGSSLSRCIAGEYTRCLKTKWRTGNAATGPIVVGFAWHQVKKDTIVIMYDDTITPPFTIVKVGSRLPAGIQPYPEQPDSNWAANPPRAGSANGKWKIAADVAMAAYAKYLDNVPALGELFDGPAQVFRLRSILEDRVTKGKREFLVAWIGFRDGDTWEPEDSLRADAEASVQAYLKVKDKKVKVEN